MILIAGAGLAGLSAAYHLGDRDYRIIERAERPGGLCRTERVGDYSFDYGGHLLHLQSDYVRGLVKDLLGDKLVNHNRRSSIYSKGVTTPYPFQVNTHGLPPKVVRDCLLGFIDTMMETGEKGAPDNFHDWILQTFGKGFAEHFFMPWNKKFFKTDLHEITDEWTGWSIPRPELRDVIKGALGIGDKEFGYNVEFYYPKGGIEELPRALAGALKRPVETGVELIEVIPEAQMAILSTGEEVHYDHLVSSVPLDRLLSMLSGAPDEIKKLGEGLRVLSVLCMNMVISGPRLTDQHWIYVPEPEYTFHRIGLYSNFMDPAPQNNALYLELTVPGPKSDPDTPEINSMLERAASEFKGMPLFKGSEHRIELMEPFLIEHGYVIYDQHRKNRLPEIIDYLSDHDIEPVGRYGRWEYSTMEAAILSGLRNKG
jgi:protoporphyrinogen oxidase